MVLNECKDKHGEKIEEQSKLLHEVTDSDDYTRLQG